MVSGGSAHSSIFHVHICDLVRFECLFPMETRLRIALPGKALSNLRKPQKAQRRVVFCTFAGNRVLSVPDFFRNPW